MRCRYRRSNAPGILGPIAHPYQFALQIARGLPAIVGILGQALLHEPFEAGWRQRLTRAERRGVLLQDRGDHPSLRIRLEWPRRGEHLVKKCAEREDIGARIDLLPSKLFGARCTAASP